MILLPLNRRIEASSVECRLEIAAIGALRAQLLAGQLHRHQNVAGCATATGCGQPPQVTIEYTERQTLAPAKLATIQTTAFKLAHTEIARWLECVWSYAYLSITSTLEASNAACAVATHGA